MEQRIGIVVDEKTLAECFAIYSRVHIKATKYTRDDSDIYSPMMAQLRQDGCKDDTVIDGFLAIQRFLGLRGLGDMLFEYTHRILLLARAMNNFDHTVLPFVADPRKDLASAVFFRALAGDFFWDREHPKSVEELLSDVTSKASKLLKGKNVQRLHFDANPIRQVETVTDLGVFVNTTPSDKARLH